jgi:hypothetical protein
MRSRCRLLALLILLLMLQPAPAARAHHAVRTVATIDQSSGPPRTDGTYVVWLTRVVTPVSLVFRLQAQRLDDPVGPGDQFGTMAVIPFYEVDGGVVVWGEQEYAVNFTTLYAHDLNTRETWPIASGVMAYSAFSGDHVSWWQLDAETNLWHLMVRNIRTMEPAASIKALAAQIGQIQMEGDRIIWAQLSGWTKTRGYWDLYEISLEGAGERRLVADAGRGWGISFALGGDWLVYTEQTVEVALNLATGAQKEFMTRGSDASFDGRYLFTQELRPGDDDFWQHGYRDFWAYDLLTDSMFQLWRSEHPLCGRNPAFACEILSSQAYSSAAAGLVVWQEGGAFGATIRVAPVADLVPAASVAPPPTNSGVAYFPETSHTLRGTFKGFWEAHGGLPVFGYPLTEELVQRSRDTDDYYTVQYVERQRYEQHPEHAGSVYEVLLGRLGAETLALQGRDWQSFPRASASAPHYFSETGHAIAPEFWGYWSSHGLEFDGRPGAGFEESLALFGYPISEPAMETNSSGDTVLTQWFERASFEYHPGNPEPYRVLLGRLAAGLLEHQW